MRTGTVAAIVTVCPGSWDAAWQVAGTQEHSLNEGASLSFLQASCPCRLPW